VDCVGKYLLCVLNSSELIQELALRSAFCQWSFTLGKILLSMYGLLSKCVLE
jgi:hypothetical protein